MLKLKNRSTRGACENLACCGRIGLHVVPSEYVFRCFAEEGGIDSAVGWHDDTYFRGGHVRSKDVGGRACDGRTDRCDGSREAGVERSVWSATTRAGVADGSRDDDVGSIDHKERICDLRDAAGGAG